MTHEHKKRGPKIVRGVHPIKLGWFARIAHSGDSDDTGMIHLEQSEVPVRVTKPKGNNGNAGLKYSKQVNAHWGKEIVTKENY